LVILSGAILRQNELGVRAGALCLLAGLLLFLWNAVKVFTHFWRPQIKPLAAATPVSA
jgi:hypothetical protein